MTGEVWQGVLSSLPEDKRRVLLEIEFKRIHLSHALGLLQYEITRLKRLAGEFDHMAAANAGCEPALMAGFLGESFL